MATKISDKLKVKVAGYFKLYPKHETLFATEDGNVFLIKTPAVNHAKKSKQEWYELSADDCKVVPQEETYTEEEAKQALAGFELNSECDWDEIRKIGKALGVYGKSKDDYIKALTPIKEELLNDNRE